MCDSLTLTPPHQPQGLELGLDFHKVLAATIVHDIEIPSVGCIDALIELERLRCRITIISFTGHEGYARAASQTAHFRDYARSCGLQMGGGIFLTNGKTGPDGKAPLISRLGICAYVDDDRQICNEVERTGCYVYHCDASRLNNPHSVLMRTLPI